jgi:DnaJ-class molecular chaperone
MSDMRFRGVVIAIDCDVCEGEGALYTHGADRFKSPCPSCDGTGERRTTVSPATFAALMNPTPTPAGR